MTVITGLIPWLKNIRPNRFKVAQLIYKLKIIAEAVSRALRQFRGWKMFVSTVSRSQVDLEAIFLFTILPSMIKWNIIFSIIKLIHEESNEWKIIH